MKYIFIEIVNFFNIILSLKTSVSVIEYIVYAFTIENSSQRVLNQANNMDDKFDAKKCFLEYFTFKKSRLQVVDMEIDVNFLFIFII